MPPPRTFRGPLPARVDKYLGLSYSLWLPARKLPVHGGVVIMHGAGSAKESHYDFARALLPRGLAALAFDARGHGDSDGPLDARMIEDVATMADVLRRALGDGAAPIGLRGSSMGGLLALLAGPLVEASAIVAICPAQPDAIARGVKNGRFEMAVDAAAVIGLLDEIDLMPAIEQLEIPLMVMHAEGDEQVPVEHSKEIAARARQDTTRLVTVPGGHHRSIQHDEELQATSLRFLDQYLR